MNVGRTAACITLAAILCSKDVLAQGSTDRASCDAGVIEAATGAVWVVSSHGVRMAGVAGFRLCPGDAVRTGGVAPAPISFPEVSRATLRFAREGKLVRLGADAVVTLPAAEGGVDLERGVIYVLGLFRRTFEVRTRYVTAGIDGTEATVHVAPELGALVAVREGVVIARGAGESVTLAADGAAFAAPGRTPRVVTAVDADTLPAVFRPYVVRADWAVDWAAHYPAHLLAIGGDPETQAAARAIAEGRIAEAEAELDCREAPARRDLRGATCAMLAALLDRRDGEPGGPGLETFAAAADPASPDDPAAWSIAQSHVHQALGRLDAARRFAAAAVSAAPEDPHAAARLAEIDLLGGDARAARDRLTPLVPPPGPDRISECGDAPAHVHAVLGLARLATYDFAAAPASFDCAIAADPNAPLGWLGRGLGRIRAGDASGGLADLEDAVALDPAWAAGRVWLGRALIEAGRDDRASAHLDLAVREDPDDPTPRLFRAMQRYAANDPLGALAEVEAALALAPRRSTQRSTVGLGEDGAVFGASLGRIYDVLGFDQLAVREGARAAERQPGSPAAQGFLASALRARPEAEVSRASAQLRADLLSPPTASPLQPEIRARKLALLDTVGAARVAFAEFSPLFDADGVRVWATAGGGTQGTFGNEISVAGLSGRTSLAFGQLFFTTDGYRANNDVEHAVYALQGRAQVSPDLTLFAEVRHRDTEAGDRSLEFDFSDVARDQRGSFSAETLRLGATWRPDPRTTVLALGTTGRFKETVDFSIFDARRFFSEGTAVDLQVEGSRVFDGGAISVGGGFHEIDGESRTQILGLPPAVDIPNARWHASVYGLLDLEPSDWLDLTIGAAVERAGVDDGDDETRTRISPRLGLVVTPVPDVTLRAAWFGAIARAEAVSESLERATIAGFETMIDDDDVFRFERAGFGVDWRIARRTWVGAESTWTRLVYDDDPDAREEELRLHVAHGLTDRVAISADLRRSWGSSQGVPARLDRRETYIVPVGLRWFDPSGVFAGAQASYVDHRFRENRGVGIERGSDSGVIVDLSAGYRFPGRRGALSFEVRNLFDTSIGIASEGALVTDVTAPVIAPSLTALMRLTVSF